MADSSEKSREPREAAGSPRYEIRTTSDESDAELIAES